MTQPEPRSTYLAGDEVLTHGQRHLNGVGFVRDGDGVESEPVSAIQRAGLVHRILKHLLVAFLAQHRADIHDFHLAAAQSAGAGEQNKEHKEAHGGKNLMSYSGRYCMDQESTVDTVHRWKIQGSSLMFTAAECTLSLVRRSVCVCA